MSNFLQYPMITTGLNGQELSLLIKDGTIVWAPLQKATEAAALSYAATITQTGTADPVPLLMANTIGNGDWSRIDANNYELSIYAGFPIGMTFFNKGVDIDGNYLYHIDNNTIGFYVAGGDGTISDYPIKVDVYQYIITPLITGFTATAISESQIDLAWDAVTGANFVLQYSVDEASWLDCYSGSTNSFSNIDLQNETQFFYRVTAQITSQLDSDWVYADATTLTPP
jgi:hypothetical protein